MKLLAIIAALASATLAEPPARWFPPASGSPCWRAYEGCIIDAYAERGGLTESEFRRRLEECKIGLTACALFEHLRDLVGDDAAAAFIGSIDPAAVEELVALFEK